MRTARRSPVSGLLGVVALLASLLGASLASLASPRPAPAAETVAEAESGVGGEAARGSSDRGDGEAARPAGPGRRHSPAIDRAREAAEAWAELVDAADYAGSHAAAAAVYRERGTAERFALYMQRIRGGLGAVVSRSLSSAEIHSRIPGAPDGLYVVLQFETDFEQRPAVVETFIPTLEADGEWRVASYAVR